jgi:preprotein translocase subunit SecD
MFKNRLVLKFAFILFLFLFCFNLVYPDYSNKGINFLNEKTSLNLPQFPEVPFKLGLDLQGGVHLVYEADLSDIEEENYSSSMQGLRDVIERRVNFFGVEEPLVQTEKAGDRHRLIVELAGVIDPERAIEEIGKTPFLVFRKTKANYEEIIEKNQEVSETGEGETEDPFEDTSLTGKYLEKAEVDFDPTTYKPLVLLRFNEEGSDIFEELTSENTGKPLAIFIDDVLMSSPMVQEKISGGKAQISGSFSDVEARDLARNLNAGALPVPISLVSQQIVGPTLGKISIQESLKAGIIGLMAVVLFLVAFYRLPGFLASLALGLYVCIVLSLFKLIPVTKFIPVTLTLAGVGGFILSIGIAIDANILIFSRIREELSEGKSFSFSLEEGFRRAWPSIRDGNLTTLLVSFILFQFGTSFIKGFALALSIGILVSMFSAIFVTRTLLELFKNKKLSEIKWLWI